ncbi:MAG: G5 domain-containing protein [Chloroflexi bacterium]|nr:G5 domain-containing protein [Chloroflexota bacterium]
MTRLDETQPSIVASDKGRRIPTAARRRRPGGCERWLLLAIILATSCSLVFTVALFLRALPKSAGARVNGAQVTVEQAGVERAVTIDMKGEKRLIHTSLENPWDILQSAGFAVDEADRIWVNGVFAKLEALPGWTVPAREIKIRRAVRLTIIDDGEESTHVARADSVGAALAAAGIKIHPSDTVTPPLETALAGDMTVTIKRALPIKLLVDGVLIQARTNMTRVGEALVELNAPLFGLDTVLPPADAPVSRDMTIEIVRVLEDIVTESAPIDFAVKTRLDESLQLDAVAVLQEGRAGLQETRYRTRFENGAEVSRELIETVIVEAPVDRIVAYGAKIVTLGTVPGANLPYWRRICVIATNYDPESQGGSYSTATGARLAKGVIAAKPHIIPYHTSVYVPGYGEGAIRDTGAGPRSTAFWIDLGYGSRAEAEAAKAHTRYTWVYHLWPPPEKIIYILPPWKPSVSYPSGGCSG